MWVESGLVTEGIGIKVTVMSPNILYPGVKRGKYDVWSDNNCAGLTRSDPATQRITSFNYMGVDI
jgi:hypothetical protein